MGDASSVDTAKSTGDPECYPQDTRQLAWYQCGLVGSDYWFGVSYNLATWEEASFECAQAGGQYSGEILSISDQNTDICTWHALSVFSGGLEEHVFLSGKLNAKDGTWYWCPNATDAISWCICKEGG